MIGPPWRRCEMKLGQGRFNGVGQMALRKVTGGRMCRHVQGAAEAVAQPAAAGSEGAGRA